MVLEPGRRIVRHELAQSGGALPWLDMEAFARRAVKLAWEDLRKIRSLKGRVFFDRGLIDAAVALKRAAGVEMAVTLQGMPQFYPSVFIAPPWKENFYQDEQRRSKWSEALEEYEALRSTYLDLGFELVQLPKAPVADRVSFILGKLG